jgi:hypothetical protein
MQIRSMGLADGTLLVHDGEQAQLYSVDAEKLEAQRGGGFQCQALALALLKSDAVVRRRPAPHLPLRGACPRQRRRRRLPHACVRRLVPGWR